MQGKKFKLAAVVYGYANCIFNFPETQLEGRGEVLGPPEFGSLISEKGTLQFWSHPLRNENLDGGSVL